MNWESITFNGRKLNSNAVIYSTPTEMESLIWSIRYEVGHS